jgi:hypothetical protein
MFETFLESTQSVLLGVPSAGLFLAPFGVRRCGVPSSSSLMTILLLLLFGMDFRSFCTEFETSPPAALVALTMQENEKRK